MVNTSAEIAENLPKKMSDEVELPQNSSPSIVNQNYPSYPPYGHSNGHYSSPMAATVTGNEIPSPVLSLPQPHLQQPHQQQTEPQNLKIKQELLDTPILAPPLMPDTDPLQSLKDVKVPGYNSSADCVKKEIGDCQVIIITIQERVYNFLKAQAGTDNCVYQKRKITLND